MRSRGKIKKFKSARFFKMVFPSQRRSEKEDNSYQTTITVVLMLFIIISATLLRLITRKHLKQPLGLDDYLIFVAAAFNVGFAIVFPFANLFGNGKHIYTLRPDQISNYLRTIFVSEQLYGVAITCIKLSVLAFYRRIFVQESFRKLAYILGSISIAWYFTNTFLFLFQCNPIQKAWNTEVPGTCIASYSVIFIAIQVPNIILDLVILALPVRQVSKLQMSPFKKLSVIGLFLLGSFGVISSILRLAFTIIRVGKEDPTYNTEIGNWALIEPSVQLLAACLPVIHPLMRVRLDWSTLRSRLTFSGRSTSRGRTTFSKYTVAQIIEKNKPSIGIKSNNRTIIREDNGETRAEHLHRSSNWQREGQSSDISTHSTINNA